ncbi:DHA1 family bicyclomycin/chloramphenicol resistance-like MFS transporter [Dysgonomonas hofstadii]|uniref:DHA1 family bicyclomycin/chloramphenicol resistance-like MFS transporter n=1 Tax=Dysgonomonas hofstadii TaxID=637886 RepID=A0A840CMT4_9BACT|nr:multidrug effflux MFS transporter [Dysgonomonas hofstadii]MBB4035999.1 DHA1 family bicyclomycin/chloramphenicol resistance-like MFS transporter [Dysgonomonas hofstadii]
MKGFTLTQWIVVIILALLTALEPLSIDLYLPGFLMISESLSTSVASVQISLSTFLAGFAVGQLIWGPLADKFGRKKPILVSLVIFILASVACMYVRSIEQLWVIRFVQAIGGCAGVVISRAIVTDYYDKSKTLKIFALLALIMGIAPILAPSIGNAVLQYFSWKGLFGTMMSLGIILFALTLFFLPETHKQSKPAAKVNVVKDYLQILKNRKFVIYSLIAGIVNGALMIYVANGPFLIMEKGGFSSDAFSIIFAVNAFGLMLGSYLTTIFQKYVKTNNLVKYALLFMSFASVVLLAAMYMNVNMNAILIVLFFYVFPIGILFPTTTELAITPFADTNNSGTASALFGSIQLAMAFVCTILSSFISDGSIVAVGIAFFLCSILAFVIVFSRINMGEEYRKHPVQ